MKRKVIQLAGKTSVISLPSKWVKKYNVKKGDEVEVIENGSDLVVKTNNSSAKESITLDVSKFNKRAFGCAMSALHKIGYDEVTLLHDKPLQVKELQEHMNNLFLGFVVIDQTAKKTVLKSIATDIETEFDASLRRAFLVTLSLADSTLELIENTNFDNLESLLNLENTNNQLTSFCLRLINKGMYKDAKKMQFVYVVIWNLEKIADEYKYICRDLSTNKNKINKDTLDLYKRVNIFLKSYYELFYKFSVDSMNALLEERNNLVVGINGMNARNNTETRLLNYLGSIVGKLYDLSSSIFAMHYDNIKELKQFAYSNS